MHACMHALIHSLINLVINKLIHSFVHSFVQCIITVRHICEILSFVGNFADYFAVIFADTTSRSHTKCFHLYVHQKFGHTYSSYSFA